MSSLAVPSAANWLVAADGRTLPLRSMQLAVTAGGGLARTVLTQRFVNVHAEALHVDYRLPLPADGAVTAFTFRIGEQVVAGRIETRSAARARYEDALETGRTASLLEQERSSLFTQQLANVPPGTELVAEITIDQPLLWQTSGDWEYRFPTTVTPRYLGDGGRVADAERTSATIADGGVPARVRLQFAADDAAPATVRSPSHVLAANARDLGFAAADGVPPDRDVVLRWPGAPLELAPALRTARPAADAPHAAAAYGLLTLAPPLRAPRVVARDVVVLLDVSGSMDGEPLQQAVAVVHALIDDLTDRDRLVMTAFASTPVAWHRSPRRADTGTRAEAQRWLAALRASGSTEMHTALLAALTQLRPQAQTQVLLVTDGAIGFEHEIVREVLAQLPDGCRLHVLGVGSAPNRSLTAPVARAGRGCEAIAGIGEDPNAATARLQAAMLAPLVTDLRIDGSALLDCAPARLPDLLTGAPLRLALQLRADGGELRLRGTTSDGPFERTIAVPATAIASGDAAVVTRYGRERIEDLELAVASDRDVAVCEREIERIGLQFGLASRCTSWLAVADGRAVDPSAPARRAVAPHALPHGLSVAGLGLRPAWGSDAVMRSLHAAGVMFSMSAPTMAEEQVERRSRLASEPPEGPLFLRQSIDPSLLPPPSPRTVRCRGTRNRLLTFELTGFTGDWLLPEHVVLRWSDGTELTVAPHAANPGTASGPVTADLLLRLVLALPDGASPVAPIAIRIHGEWLRVTRA